MSYSVPHPLALFDLIVSRCKIYSFDRGKATVGFGVSVVVEVVEICGIACSASRRAVFCKRAAKCKVIKLHTDLASVHGLFSNKL